MNLTQDQLIANLGKQGIFELLLTRYWELAYLEGKDSVSHGDEAQETLNELRELFAELLTNSDAEPVECYRVDYPNGSYDYMEVAYYDTIPESDKIGWKVKALSGAHSKDVAKAPAEQEKS